MRLLALVPVLLLLVTSTACGRGDGIIDLRSDAFDDRGPIPERHSCEGENLSPPLEWAEVDEDAVELALVMADFDTENGIFHHWVVLGIDPDVRSMPAGRLPSGAVLARTTADNAVYIGPCPPVGETHEYLFTLFQLDRRLDLPEGTPTEDALDAIDEARLPGEGELRGTFGR